MIDKYLNFRNCLLSTKLQLRTYYIPNSGGNDKFIKNGTDLTI